MTFPRPSKTTVADLKQNKRWNLRETPPFSSYGKGHLSRRWHSVHPAYAHCSPNHTVRARLVEVIMCTLFQHAFSQAIPGVQSWHAVQHATSWLLLSYSHQAGSMLCINSHQYGSMLCIKHQYASMLCIKHQYGSMLCIKGDLSERSEARISYTKPFSHASVLMPKVTTWKAMPLSGAF